MVTAEGMTMNQAGRMAGRSGTPVPSGNRDRRALVPDPPNIMVMAAPFGKLRTKLRLNSGQGSDLMPNVIRYPKNPTQCCVGFVEVFINNDAHHNKDKNPLTHVRGSWGKHATHQEKNPLPYGAWLVGNFELCSNGGRDAHPTKYHGYRFASNHATHPQQSQPQILVAPLLERSNLTIRDGAFKHPEAAVGVNP